MKCDICGNKVAETFLKKIVGSVVKDEKGKKHFVCSNCQAKFKTKEDMLKQIK